MSITPLHLANCGTFITPKDLISNWVVGNWKYADECANVGSGLVANFAKLEIVEKSPYANKAAQWVKVALPAGTLPGTLKLSYQEYALYFLTVQ